MAVNVYLKEAASLLQRASAQLESEARTIQHDLENRKRSLSSDVQHLQTDVKVKEAEQLAVNDDQTRAALVSQIVAEKREADDKKQQLSQTDAHMRKVVAAKLDAANELKTRSTDLERRSADPIFR